MMSMLWILFGAGVALMAVGIGILMLLQKYPDELSQGPAITGTTCTKSWWR